jgi:cobalamin synthase
MQSSRAYQQVESEPLRQEAVHVLEEARMVLPGIQALFGFQLIAVFNQRFSEIPEADQILHLAALVLTATSAALIMTPAAYHRQAERGQLSAYFIDLASTLITLAMVPLALGICLDAFVVARLILEDLAAAAIVAVALLCLFSALWFAFPRLQARRSR